MKKTFIFSVLIITTLLLPGYVQAKKQPRIIGGTDAEPFSYPWMLSLQDENSKHFCGAVLIDQRWALTAKHCISEEERGGEGYKFKIIYHAHNFEEEDKKEGRKEIFYKRIICNNQNKDLALLELDLERGDLSGEDKREISKSAIDIASEIDLEYAMLSGETEAKAIGWGCTKHAPTFYFDEDDFDCKPSKTLREIKVELSIEHFYYYRIVVNSDNGEFNNRVAFGDSGGPLMISSKRDGRMKLIGISKGESGLNSIYMAVMSFRRWISDVVADSYCDNVSTIKNIQLGQEALFTKEYFFSMENRTKLYLNFPLLPLLGDFEVYGLEEESDDILSSKNYLFTRDSSGFYDGVKFIPKADEVGRYLFKWENNPSFAGGYGITRNVCINVGDVSNIEILETEYLLDFSAIPELEKVIRKTINKPESERSIFKYDKELTNLPKIDISNLKIGNEQLYENSHNTISDLVYIQARELHASNNNLDDFGFNANTTNLEIANLSHNNFVSVQLIFPLGNNKKIKIKNLDLSHNKIVDKHPFFPSSNFFIFKENFQEIETLNLSYNLLSDAGAIIENLGTSPKLTYLNLEENKFSKEDYKKLKEKFGDVLYSSPGELNLDGKLDIYDLVLALDLATGKKLEIDGPRCAPATNILAEPVCILRRLCGNNEECQKKKREEAKKIRDEESEMILEPSAVQRIPLHAGWNSFSFSINKVFYVNEKPDCNILYLESCSEASESSLDFIPVESLEKVFLDASDSLKHGLKGDFSYLRGHDSGGAKSYNKTDFSDLDYLSPGHGYWIKVDQDANFDKDGLVWIEFSGKQLDPNTKLYLKTGWNFVGYTGTTVNYAGERPRVPFLSLGSSSSSLYDVPNYDCENIRTVFGSIDRSLFEYFYIRGFDRSGAKSYLSHYEKFSDLTYVGPGYGYWIKLKEKGDLKSSSKIDNKKEIKFKWLSCAPEKIDKNKTERKRKKKRKKHTKNIIFPKK